MQPLEVFDGCYTALEWRQSVNAVTLSGSHGKCEGEKDDADDVSHTLLAHPTNPVECCADANPKTMLPNDT